MSDDDGALVSPDVTPATSAGTDAVQVVEVRHGQFGIHGSPDVSGYGGLVSAVVLPPASEPPYGEPFDDIVAELRACLGADFDSLAARIVVELDEITFHVPRAGLRRFVQTLRDEPTLRFEMCLGVSGVHWPAQAGAELHAVYHFQSLTHNRFVRVETTCPDADPHIPSITDIYPTNDWHERETYDFFGIIFDGHFALTRIMMPDDWVGHPQRKDYPLGGIPVEYKGATTPPPDERRCYS